jgi:hypothetical protein
MAHGMIEHSAARLWTAFERWQRQHGGHTPHTPSVAALLLYDLLQSEADTFPPA